MSYTPPPTETPDDILRRVARESESIASSSVSRVANETHENLEREKITPATLAGEYAKSLSQRAQNHFRAQDAYDENLGHDPAEVWGRRIGRALSLIAVVALAYMLYLQMKM